MVLTIEGRMVTQSKNRCANCGQTMTEYLETDVKKSGGTHKEWILTCPNCKQKEKFIMARIILKAGE